MMEFVKKKNVKITKNVGIEILDALITIIFVENSNSFIGITCFLDYEKANWKLLICNCLN